MAGVTGVVFIVVDGSIVVESPVLPASCSSSFGGTTMTFAVTLSVVS